MRKTPLKSARRRNPGDGMDKPVPTPLTGEQKQKKRTCDVLLKPDNLIRYRHFSCICLQKIRNVVIVSARVDIVSEAAPRADGFDAVGPEEKLDVGRKSRRNPLKSHKRGRKRRIIWGGAVETEPVGLK
jgi:hypothetical protein